VRTAVWWLIVGSMLLAPRAGARSVAVLPLGEPAAEILAPVRQTVGGVTGIELTAMESMAIDIDAARRVGLACGPDSDECLVKLALFLHVDQLVVLVANRTPQGLALEAALIDAATGRRSGQVETLLGAADRVRRIEDAMLLLLAPDQHFGMLEIRASPADARVTIDGFDSEIGAQRYRAGPHDIVVVRKGYIPHKATVVVQPAATAVIDVVLEPVVIAPPPAVVSPGGIVAGVGTALFILATGTALSVEALLRTPDAIPGAQARADALQAERIAAGAAVVGAVGVGVGLALLVGAD
jgi:hypothetical protein